MIRWGTEIGRVDILHEVLILSQYQASPRDGHIEQLLHIWAFLDKNPKLTLYFDHSRPLLDYGSFKTKRRELENNIEMRKLNYLIECLNRGDEV